jgi:hypothetical protein
MAPLLGRWLCSWFALFYHLSVNNADWLIAHVPELMNLAAWAVESLARQDLAWLTSVGTDLNRAFDDRTVTVTMMCVPRVGTPWSNRYCNYERFHIVLAAYRTLEYWFKHEARRLSAGIERSQRRKYEKKCGNCGPDRTNANHGIPPFNVWALWTWT